MDLLYCFSHARFIVGLLIQLSPSLILLILVVSCHFSLLCFTLLTSLMSHVLPSNIFLYFNNVVVTSLHIYIYIYIYILLLYGLTQINPLGWQPGIQEGAADWDELEDKGNRNNTN